MRISCSKRSEDRMAVKDRKMFLVRKHELLPDWYRLDNFVPIPFSLNFQKFKMRTEGTHVGNLFGSL